MTSLIDDLLENGSFNWSIVHRLDNRVGSYNWSCIFSRTARMWRHGKLTIFQNLHQQLVAVTFKVPSDEATSNSSPCSIILIPHPSPAA